MALTIYDADDEKHRVADSTARTTKTLFEPALRRAKLPAVRFHDLRHSYASVLIEQGAHPKVISDQLGHASVQITMDRYSHLFDGAYSDVNDELEKA